MRIRILKLCQFGIQFNSCCLWTKIYNEKEQAKKGKTQNVQFKENRITRKQNGSKYCVQGDKCFKNGIMEVMISGKDATQLRLQLMKRNFKKIQSGEVVPNFNPSTQKSEADRFLSLSKAALQSRVPE